MTDERPLGPKSADEAEVFDAEARVFRAEVEANRLRASRDELLEALEEVANLAADHGLPEEGPTISTARAAIVKARGQRDG